MNLSFTQNSGDKITALAAPQLKIVQIKPPAEKVQ
jgi:hypothetical protein